MTDIHLKDFAQLCAENCGKKVVFELPSETEQKGFSIAVQAILSNERIKGIGFMPHYSITNAINRTIQILK